MSDENIPRHEYTAAWVAHKDVHTVLDANVTQLKTVVGETAKVQSDQLFEMKDIKWLLVILVCGTMPHLIAFIKGLIHP